MADITSPVAICPVCWKPLADLPAVLRQGDQYVHANCWTGEEPAEKATAEPDGAEERPEPGRLKTGNPRSAWYAPRVPRRDGRMLGLVEIVALLAMILALLAVVLTLAGFLDDALEVVRRGFVR